MRGSSRWSVSARARTWGREATTVVARGSELSLGNTGDQSAGRGRGVAGADGGRRGGGQHKPESRNTRLEALDGYSHLCTARGPLENLNLATHGGPGDLACDVLRPQLVRVALVGDRPSGSRCDAVSLGGPFGP